MNRGEFLRNMFGGIALSLVPKIEAKTIRKKQQLLQCFVAGFRYYNGPQLLNKMEIGDTIKLVREPNNKYDNKAIALYFQNNKIGFIPQMDNQVICNMMDANLLELQAEISYVNPKKDTWEQVEIIVNYLR
jgi:hypothetical protein